MTVIELLARLSEKNVMLSVKGDDLVVRGKEQVLETPELLELLRKNKKALVEHIKAGKYVDPRGIVQVPPNRIPPACEAITPEMLPLAQLTQPEIDRIVDGVPGGAPNIQDIYPLGPLQEGMLFHHLLTTEVDVYLTYTMSAYSTRALLDRVLKALQDVIDRHDILRTAVFWEGLSEPVQVVWRQAPLTVEEVSIEPTAGDVAEALYARFNPRLCRLDLRKAPMMRVYIAKDAREDRWVMLHLFHHLSIDHVAFDVMMEEIKAHLMGQAEQLPAPWPFRNFVAQARMGVSREEHESFFRNMLGDVDEPTAPYGLVDVYGDGSGIEEAMREVDAGLVIRLRQISRTLEVTAASLCHLAWALALGRVSGRDDVVFGTILFGRLHGVEGADRVIGMLLNTLPIRIRLDDKSVEESARLAHQSLTELMKHEHASLALARKCSAVEPPAPLFTTLLNYRYGVAAETLTGSADNTFRASEKIEFLKGGDIYSYPLSLGIDDFGERLALTAHVRSPADPERICAYMHTALEQLVETLARAPSTSARDLDVLPDSERYQLLIEWNATQAEFPPPTCLQDLFEEQANQTPDSVAVVYDESYLSYSELNGRANRLARYLQELGVWPEVRVGICLERSIEMVVGLLGTLKAGGAYVPMDTTYPDARLKVMVEDAGLRIILTQESLARRFSERSAELVCIDRDWGIISTQSSEDLNARVWPDNAAYVIFTSGSTGRPKGVLVTHRSVLNLFNAIDAKLHFSENDVWTMFHSYSFDFSVWEMWGALIYGGTLVVVPHLVTRAPEEFCDLVGRKGVTILSQTPSAFRHFIKADDAAGASGDLSLRAVIFGGEALEFQMLKEWVERRGDESPELINMYGITETTVHTTYKKVTSESLKENCGSVIGKPLANVRLYLFNDQLQPAPPGVVGELYVAGEGMARGYTAIGSLTADRFRPAPYGQPGERIYKTGDLARYLSDGDIEYLGRKDDQVKIRGYRIELGEIESALLQHDGIAEAVVIATGEAGEEKRLIAYVAPGNGAQLDLSGLRSYLKEKLPDYMAPAAFVQVEKLPLTPNGKLDRKALPEAWQEGSVGEKDYVAPQTPVEEMVAGIFEELLKLDRVGIQDDFFEAGGHSLLAIQLISRVRNAFKVEVGIRSVFDAPTVKGLAGGIEEAIKAGEKDDTPPLVRLDREGQGELRLPLSFAQQRLWFIDQMNPGSAVYNITGGMRLNSGLKLDVLEQVINEIVRRHEVFRTRFEVEAGDPIQVIDAWAPRKLDVIDLTSIPPKERGVEVARRAREEAETGFDLRRGPLFRVKIFKLGEAEDVLLYNMHHIVSDEWSTELLNKEVGTLYQSYLEEEESPLPELEIQYADFAVWQRAYLSGEVLDREVGYWREQLKDAAVLELPTDRVRPAAPSHRGGWERLELGHSVIEGLRMLSRREGATLFMTLMAAFKVVLMRYCGQEDVSVGTAIANRTRKEVEGLIGFFVNTLVMRTDLSGNPSFKELLKREREVALGAYAHQEAPFEKLVEEINPERDLSRSPLFQIMMLMGRSGRETLELPGVKLSGGSVSDGVETGGEGQSVKFDLTLSIMDLGAELAGVMEYSRDLFEAGTIERLNNHYINVLEGVVNDSERPIWSLGLLSEGERKQIVEEWNTTEADYPKEKLIHELFEDQVERSPDAIALVYEEQSLTYGQLNAEANRLAHYLRRLGVGPDVLVGILLDSPARQVVSLLAVLKAGGAYLPLDTQYPPQRLAFMLEDARLRALITDSAWLTTLPLPVEQIVCLDDMEEALAAEPADNPQSGIESGNLCYVLYTSGSTGQPKGAMLTHQGVVNCLCWMQETYRLSADDRFLFKTTLNFDPSVWEICWPLWAGGSLVAAEAGRQADVDYLVELMAEQGVTSVYFVPSMLRAWLAAEGLEGLVGLRRVICGGEAVSAEVVRRYYQRVGAELHHSYGPTETSIAATEWVCEAEAERVVMGRPLGNVRLYVLDRWKNPTPVGVNGELYIGGEGVGRGYLYRGELTAERFVPDGFSLGSGARLYRSGDVVRYRGDGAVEYVGRSDEQVKLRGYRIELGEVEAALRRCAGVNGAALALRTDSEGEGRLVGYVVAERTSKAPSGRELREYLRGQLPEHMIPSVFVLLDDLPLMTNGKLDRRALPAPDVRGAEERDGYLGLRTPVEEIVVGIFEDMLKLDRVGRKDNFFELGGHSLSAVQVISRVRNSFGVEIGVRSVFESATAEGLSCRIEEAMRAGEKVESPPLVRVERERQRGGSFPLSFAQQRLWFIDRLNPGSPLYNNPEMVKIGGALNLEAFERVINEITRRHEVLRTRFEVEAGEPAQVISQWEPRSLDVVDLTSLDPEERKAEVIRRAREEAETGFDLSQGPLLRVRVLKLEVDEHIVLYTMHHIVSDAWSMEILSREVETLYQSYLAGDDSPLPELPIQYADFAVWQRSWLQGEALEEKLEYWRRRLAGMEDLDLPTDHPRPSTRSHRGSIRHFVVERELTRKLRELSQREGVTLFMVMLGGFDVLMSRYSGQRDVVVGTDTANRNRAEIEGLIGFFVNQLVMRVEVRTEESFKGLLKRVRDVCLEAYAHEDAPFEKLVEELRPERDLSRSPLFQAKLIWKNAQGSMSGPAAMSLVVNDGSEVQMENDAQMARFDLLVSVADVGSELVGLVEYSRDLFEGETIGRLISHYVNVLGEISDGSERPISTLDMLGGAEREQIVVEWNRTETHYVNDWPIHELFAEQAERTPERIALIGGGKLVSYRELNRRADQLGSYLQSLGVGPEVVVGVCLERSVEMIVAILGTLKAGGAYLPLDPEFPAERLVFLLEDAGARVILTQQSLEDRLQAFKGQTVLIAEEWERISGERECSQKGGPERVCETENLAYVIYTSGSTGKPKGVMVRHQSLVNYSRDICRRLGVAEGAEDHNLQFATVSTIAADLGNTCIYPSLLSGGCLHVLRYETVIDGMRFGEYLRHEPIDVLKIVPSHLNGLLRSQPNEVKMLPQKYLILGGEALSYELVDRIRARGEGCEVINHYGPTETTIGSLMAKAPEVDVERGRARSAPIGQPIANTRSYVLDRDFNPLPVLARGELQISGEGVARGYLGRPDMTAERFVPNPFSQNGGERLYRTGDVVKCLSDGKTEFLGRVDDQVKVRGYRIELGEIQAVLNEHRGVRHSVVVAREDEKGDTRIVGYVAPEEEVTVAELKQYARERLPEYMMPETILLLEEIPITSNGKLDRKRLSALSEALQPKEESFIRSRDIFEHRLLKIWEDLLEIRPISVKDNFFDLGGHSILAAILMAQIKSEFGRELPLYVLFQEGTIERLATFLKQEANSMSWSCLVEFQSSGSKTPLFFVHPGGGNVHNYYELARCLGSDRPFYAFQQPGMYKERDLFTSIEDLAAYYIEAMKTAQPEGPYFIGGWSFGGLVAFEMAQQLFAQGQKVGQVLLLDSSAPISMKKYLGEEYEESEEDEDEDKNKDDATLLIELFGGLKFSEEELKSYEGDKRIEYVLKTGIGMNFFPPDVDIARARTYLELFRTNGRARRKYLPQVYQGSVILFRPCTPFTLPPSDGTDRSERIAKFIHENGWSDLATGGVRVIEVPGEHGTMVDKPHVETLALRIRECLDEA